MPEANNEDPVWKVLMFKLMRNQSSTNWRGPVGKSVSFNTKGQLDYLSKSYPMFDVPKVLVEYLHCSSGSRALPLGARSCAARA
jgi:hypothetical protein